MAARFAVAAGNWSDTNTWAATSGGSPGASAPVTGDTVTIDANTPAGTVVVDVASVATSVTINNAVVTLRCDASLTLNGAMVLTTGMLNTNGQAMTWKSLGAGGSLARTLTLGASAILLTEGGGTHGFSVTDATNLTVTANTAVFTCTNVTGNTNFFIDGPTSGSVLDMNGASFVASAATNQLSVLITGRITMRNLTRVGIASFNSNLNIGQDITITGTLTVGGNTTQGIYRANVFSQASAVNVTVGAVVIVGDVNFDAINIIYSGAPSWTNTGAAFVGDAGTNNAVVVANRTTPAVQAATGTTSFTWSTHAWTSRVPLPQDDVTINLAFTAGQTITTDIPYAGRNINFTGTTGSPTISGAAVNASGNVTFAAGMTVSNSWAFTGPSATLTTTGVALGGVTVAKKSGGTLTLVDNLTTTGALAVNGGTFVANGHNVTAVSVTCVTPTNFQSPQLPGTINFGSGVWTLTGTGAVINITSTAATTVPGTATITISDASGTTKNINGNGLSYPTLRHVATGAAGLTITGNNTFANLDLECTTARTITLPAGGTQTVTGTLTLSGASGQLLSLVSSTPGTATTLASTGTVASNAFVTRSADVLLNTASVPSDNAAAADTVAWVKAPRFADTSDSARALDHSCSDFKTLHVRTPHEFALATDQRSYSFTEDFRGDFRADAEYRAGYGGNMNRWSVGAGAAAWAQSTTGDHTFKHDRVFYGDVDVSAKFIIGAVSPNDLYMFLEPRVSGHPIVELYTSGSSLHLDLTGFWAGVPGTTTTITASAAMGGSTLANTTYWLRLTRVGHTITGTIYTVDPIANPGSTPVASVTQTDLDSWGYGFWPSVGGNLGSGHTLSIDDFRVVGTVDSGATWRYAAATQRDPAEVAGGLSAGNAVVTPLSDNPTYSVNTGHQTYAIGVNECAPANGGPSLLPEDIGGLAYHFRADDLAGLGHGAAVSLWADRSGNGRDAVQALGFRQPTVRLNAYQGRAAVYFDPDSGAVPGTYQYPGQWLEPPHLSLGDDFTVIAVMRRTPGGPPFSQGWCGTGYGHYYGFGNVAPAGWRLIASGVNVLSQAVNVTGNGPAVNAQIASQNGASTESSPQVYSGGRIGEVDGNNAVVLFAGRNGLSSRASTPRGQLGPSNTTRIGAAVAGDSTIPITAGAGNGGGEVYEVAVWKGRLTEAQRNAVVRGLMARYDPQVAEATAIKSTRSVPLVPATTVVDPATLSGRVGHWQADTLGLGDGAAVSTVADASGNSRPLVQATSSLQPIFKTGVQNGLGGILFDNSDDVLSVGDLSAVFATAGTVIVVANPNGDTQYSIVETRTDTDSYWRFGGNGQGYMGLFRSIRSESWPSSPPTTGGHIWTVTSSTSTPLKVYLDGSDMGVPAQASTHAVGTNFHVGKGPANAGPFGGYVFEIVTFDRVLTAAERKGAEASLAAKWGLPTVNEEVGGADSLAAQHTVPVSLTEDTGPSTDTLTEQGVYARATSNTQGAIDPSSLSGIAYRFRADDLAGADGSAVSTWPDASGNSRDATQATSGLRPVLARAAVNGRAAVRFDGVDDFLSAPIGGTYPEYETTIFVVGRAGTNTATHRFLARSRAAAAATTDFVTMFQNGATFGSTYRDGATRSATGSVALDMTKYHVMALRLSDSGGLVTDDHLADGLGQPGVPSTATTVAGGTFDTFTLGALTNNSTVQQFLPGDIAEVIVVDHPLTLAQTRGVSAWLADRYNLPRADQAGGADTVASLHVALPVTTDNVAASDSLTGQYLGARAPSDTAAGADGVARTYGPFRRTREALRYIADASGNGRVAAVTGTVPLSGGALAAGSYTISDDPALVPNGPFTWECFYKVGSVSPTQVIISEGDSRPVISIGSFKINATLLDAASATKSIAGTTVLTVGQTYHLALAWDGATAYLFIDGALEGSVAMGSILTQALAVAVGAKASGSFPMGTGATADSVRLSSTARYTSGFTAPTSPLPSDGNTLALWQMDAIIGAGDSVTAGYAPGGVYSESDTAHASDSAIVHGIYSRTGATDIATASDTATRLGLLTRLVNDTVGATDAVLRVLLASRSVTESATGLDTTTHSDTVARSGVDSVSASDSWSTASNVTRLGAEVAGASDATTRTAFSFRVSADGGATTDSVLRLTIVGRHVTATALAADTVVRGSTYTRLNTDVVSASDTVDRALVPLLIVPLEVRVVHASGSVMLGRP